MARISTYTVVSPNLDDKIIISETNGTPSDVTKNITVEGLKTFINTGNAKGSGTTNTLPIWTDGPNGVLGNSIMSQANLIGNAKRVTLGGRMTITGDGGNQNGETLIVEADSAPSIQILSPNTQTQAIKFGDPQDGDVGRISYNHASNEMKFVTNAGDKATINSDGLLKLNEYTSTSTGTSVSAINPIQNLYPSNGIGSDTTTDLGVDQEGNVVRTTQEATWKLTAAQVNAITTSTSATGTTLISAPGAGLLLIVEKVTFMITFTQDNTPNPMSATQQYQIKQLDNGAGPGIVGVIRGDKVNDIIGQGDPDGSGIYEHDTGFASLNRIYMPNTPTFIRRTESGASSSNLPPNVTHMSIKIRYRVYDPATF